MNMADKYCLVYEAEDFTDGFGSSDLEYLKEQALEILVNWMTSERAKWSIINGIHTPTSKQIDDYDYMIHHCSVSVRKYVEETIVTNDGDLVYEKLEDYWCPSNEQLKEIGWMPYEELIKRI